MSCHNPFRDNAASVAKSKLNINLSISEEDWSDLTARLKQFARDRDWSFRDASQALPGRLNSINLSLCAENSLRILVSKNHWKNTEAFDDAYSGLPVALYGDVPTEEWQQIARELVASLESQWQGRVRFVDSAGYIIAAPHYLD